VLLPTVCPLSPSMPLSRLVAVPLVVLVMRSVWLLSA